MCAVITGLFLLTVPYLPHVGNPRGIWESLQLSGWLSSKRWVDMQNRKVAQGGNLTFASIALVPNRLETQGIGIISCCHYHIFQHGKPMFEWDLEWYQVQLSPPIMTRTKEVPVHGEMASAMRTAKTTLGWEWEVEWRTVVLSADCEAMLGPVINT